MGNDRTQRAEQMRKEREKAEKRQRNVITVAIVVVVIALVAVGGYAITNVSPPEPKAIDLVAPKNATDDYGIVYDTAAAGGEAADDAEPVEVEVYEDFQCPVCKQFEQVTGPLLKQQVESGAITLVYRPGSFLDENGGSPNDYSKRSTNAAICALDAGGVEDYVKVHDYLYANQPEERTAGPENSALAEALDGLGITDVEQCITTEKFVPWIEKAKDVARDGDRAVGGTPTVYVADTKVDGFDPQSVQQAITAAAG